jgi:DNA-binding FadR family transcriptional regulator
VKRKKHFDSQRAFEFIWQDADQDGIWLGDAVELAAEFDVSEDAVEAVLDELRTRRLIEKLYTGKYIIVNWREKDETVANFLGF